MSIENQLRQIALELGTSQAVRLNQLNRQLKELDDQRAKLAADIEIAKGVERRSRQYGPRKDINFNCPRCWVQHEREAALRPIPSPTRNDLLRCATCHSEFEIEY